MNSGESLADSSSDKHFIDAQALLEDAWALAQRVLDDDWRPDLLLGLWRGGSPVAVAMHEFFCFRGLHIDHEPMKTAYYSGVDQRAEQVSLSMSPGVVQAAKRAARILVVDDVFDSGRTLEAVMAQLSVDAPDADCRSAVPWYKPTRNLSRCTPDYYLHITDRWLVFPHELCGIAATELATGKVGFDAYLSESRVD